MGGGGIVECMKRGLDGRLKAGGEATGDSGKSDSYRNDTDGTQADIPVRPVRPPR